MARSSAAATEGGLGMLPSDRESSTRQQHQAINKLIMDDTTARCRTATTGSNSSSTTATCSSVESGRYQCTTVDISSWLRPLPSSDLTPEQLEERQAAAQAVLRAATTTGSFKVTGHGVPAEVLDAVLDRANDFFAEPLDVKAACKGPTALTGFVALGTESVNALHGREGGRDRRELYGLVTPDKDPANAGLSSSLATHEAFVEALRAFGRHMDRLEVVLYALLTEALSIAKGAPLPADLLFRGKGSSGGLIRASHYPYPASDEAAAASSGGAGELPGHSDWGAVTVLHTSEPGLEELHGTEWVPVSVMGREVGALHVNLGDNMHIWSNGAFVHNVHRVNMAAAAANTIAGARTSVAYFSGQAGNASSSDDSIAIAPVCGPGEEPMFPAVSIPDYVAAGVQRYLGGANGA